MKIVVILAFALLLSPAYAFIGTGFNDLFGGGRISAPAQSMGGSMVHDIPVVLIKSPIPREMVAPLDSFAWQAATPVPITPEPMPIIPLLEQVTCRENECGSLQHGHEFAANTQKSSKLEFTILPKGETKYVEIYASQNGNYHKIAQSPITDPNKETKFSVFTKDGIDNILIHMPGSENAETKTIIEQSGIILPMMTNLSLRRP